MKPKLTNQFKAAEVNGVPFAVVLGEDELAQGKVKIKEMGLRDGHPEKEGVLVSIDDLVSEMQHRILRKSELDGIIEQADGLRVVDGIRGEPGTNNTPPISELETQTTTAEGERLASS